MIRKILIVDTPAPATPEQIAQAHALGVGEIIHQRIVPFIGIGVVTGEFEGWAPGYYEIELPDPEAEPADG